MKLEVNTDIESVKEFFGQLDDEARNFILDSFTATQVIDSLERHLQGKGDYWGWDTNGWRWGSDVRQAITEMQGIEDELREDHKSRLASVERSRNHYKKYYDWYYRLYHYGMDRQYSRLFQQVKSAIGDIDDIKLEDNVLQEQV